MKNNGFSLVEFTVYLALFSFISMLFLGVASRAQLKFMSVSSEQENLHGQNMALDLLRRDLMSASQNANDWDLQSCSAQQPDFNHSGFNHSGSEESIIKQPVFRKITLTDKNLPQTADVSWFIGNQGLTRAQGEYDFVKHEWVHKASCIVCKSIKQIDFVLQKNFDLQESNAKQGCTGVWVIYKSAGSTRAQNSFDQNSLAQKFFVKFRNRVVT